MKLLIIIVFGICLPTCLFAQQESALPIRLRVGTYNVGHFNQGMKGGLEVRGKAQYPNDKSVTEKYIKQALLSWRNWIGAQGLDILAVQEWNHYFDQDSTFLATDALLKPYYSHIYFGDAHTWIYNGIATHYALSNLRQLYWHGDYYALIGDLRVGGRTIQIISTHIPWQKEGHEKALKALIAELKKLKYFVCFGDTNSSDKDLLGFPAAGFNMANGGSQGWFVTAAGDVLLQGMKDGPNRHIDNIITSGNIKIMKVSAPYTTLNDQDHLPVLADIIISE
ncbi:hypothetical protein GCM10027051_15050 [Niabella terrae]